MTRDDELLAKVAKEIRRNFQLGCRVEIIAAEAIRIVRDADDALAWVDKLAEELRYVNASGEICEPDIRSLLDACDAWRKGQG